MIHGDVVIWRGNTDSMRPDQPVVLLESIVEGRTWVVLLENGDVVTALTEGLEAIKGDRKRRELSSGEWIVWAPDRWKGNRDQQLVMLISPLEDSRKWEAETMEGLKVFPRVEELYNEDEDGELHIAMLGGE